MRTNRSIDIGISTIEKLPLLIIGIAANKLILDFGNNQRWIVAPLPITPSSFLIASRAFAASNYFCSFIDLFIHTSCAKVLPKPLEQVHTNASQFTELTQLIRNGDSLALDDLSRGEVANSKSYRGTWIATPTMMYYLHQGQI